MSIDVRRIGDYGFISDCHSAALIRGGSVEWLCLPAFDSPSSLASILDLERGGRFAIATLGESRCSRRYEPGTNVLVSSLTTASGSIEITDCLPVRSKATSTLGNAAWHALVRRVRCTSGNIEVDIVCDPRPGYGRITPKLEERGGRWLIGDGAGRLLLESGSRLAPAARGENGLRGRLTLHAGDEVSFALRHIGSLDGGRAGSSLPSMLDVPAAIAATIDYWRAWSAKLQYDGPYRDAVLRSALVLKGLMYAPTGAIAAAPTTSLPEWFGSKRNWDYRYSWLRDSTLTLYALDELGYDEDAAGFHRWLERASAGSAADLQIAYDIHGHKLAKEHSLDYLAGFRHSQPVRIGNGARDQKQLDIFGELLDAAFFSHKQGHGVTADYWSFLVQIADHVCDHWREPDHGIWEMRTEPKQFVYSKALCWVCLNRACRLAKPLGMERPPARWSQEMDAIRKDVLEHGFNAEVGAFVQSYGSKYLDASNLALATLGFIDAKDPRMEATIRQTEAKLIKHGVVHRYLDSGDGLDGQEGGFFVCCFWLVDAFILLGERGRARGYFEHLLQYRNELGLLSEEVDGRSGDLLGNFPQAFSHLGLITSANNLAGASPDQRHLTNGGARADPDPR